jgi:hypothetical protein
LYRDADAPPGTSILFKISGECGGNWFLSKGPAQWDFAGRAAPDPVSQVTIPQDLACRLFTKGVDPESARDRVKIEGDRNLWGKILHLTAIVAADQTCLSALAGSQKL